jgi:hypothetical protein
MGINRRSGGKTLPTCASSDHPTGKRFISKLFSLAGYQFQSHYLFKTGDDTETLRKVEASIQADFKNGLPPHLQPNAKTMEYLPGSDQSRIFVASHSEFSKLHARDVQRILRDRIILVHGNPLDYNYGWDLESFGRVYDVDMQTTVHGGIITLFWKDFTNTRNSFNKIRSSQAFAPPSRWNVAGFTQDDHHPIK